MYQLLMQYGGSMTQKLKLSVLDLCPILSGETSYESLAHVAPLACYVEELGYERFWVAEHHDMEGIGSSSPEVLISHIAAATKEIRVGSGGIMLPNHATYHIAEVFRTLEALYPGRIDLGLGRAPGSGSKATHALRRAIDLSADNFPQEVEDLEKYLRDELPLKAVPARVNRPEIWMLGSSDFGARLAAHRGLPYAFAQHFSGLPAIDVINLYRRSFRPSELLDAPKAIMACHIICAETDSEAERLALSSDLSFALFFKTGKNNPLPSVNEAEAYTLSAMEREQLRATFPKFVGSPQTIKKLLAPYRAAGIDHFMVLSMIHDQKARQKSYKLLKENL